MIATTTQPLSSGEFCKLRYDTIPVKSAYANVSFCTNKSKIPNLLVVTLLSQMTSYLHASGCLFLCVDPYLLPPSLLPSLLPTSALYKTETLLPCKSSPVTGLEWPRGFQEVKVPSFHDNGTGWW